MLYIGTSGWNYPHWQAPYYNPKDIVYKPQKFNGKTFQGSCSTGQGKFYPLKLKSQDYLRYYGRFFPTVEINYSFYRLPRPTTYQNWYQQTPKDFIFAVKVSRFITHIKRLKNIKRAFWIFFDNASVLKEKLGPILFQFPPSFQATEENTKRLEGFLSILRGRTSPKLSSILGGSTSKNLRFAFEFRHQSWCDEKIYKLLKKYNAAWVIADSPNYPKVEAITADFIYVRMHGSKVLFSSKYTNKELKDLAAKIKKWLRPKLNIYVYFNNDFQGYAIDNAKQLIKLITEN